jgi:aminopeptidase
MVFKDGHLASFEAKAGAETFREYIDSDPGGRRLGEVALVGIDSPIFTSGRVFEEILFDENAACHIAVGSAYKFCIQGGDTLTKQELESIGCNESSVHTDMMISNQEVSVEAELYRGGTVALLKQGEWQGDFR